MNGPVWVYLDQCDGRVLTQSWEAMGAARTLGDEIGSDVTAIILGEDIKDAAQEALARGARQVWFADDSILKDFRPEPYTNVFVTQAKLENPSVVIFPNTSRARELAGMAAVDLNAGVIPDIISFEIQEGQIAVTRPVYAGKLLAKVVCSTQPQLITVRPRSFSPPPVQMDTTGEIQQIVPDFGESEIQTRVDGTVQGDESVSLNEATVVVSGGRGVANNPHLAPPDDLGGESEEVWRAKQGFQRLAELAAVLGGAVGASRAAVDAGYIPYEHQIGQTGKTVSPNLYIACGISGAIQHLAGMRTSKLIVAVNRDRDAPIFKFAQYGIVGDMHEIVPALTEAFRVRLER
jgi:electron transfer flavoprotein alpha subunit